MIKVVSFTFAKQGEMHSWANFAKFGPLVSYDTNIYRSVDEVPLVLNASDNFQVSCDQSTTNTGIFIKNYDNTVAYMIEFARNRDANADDFIFDLEQLMHRICGDTTVSHLIYERPINNDKFRSSQVLFQLEGMIRALPKRYREFKSATLDYIENSSWRRVVILPQFKNDEKKLASENSVKEIFEWTRLYGNSLGKDRDIFEAIGVLFGWFLNAFDALGRPYVRDDRYYGNIGCFLLPGFEAREVCEQLKASGLDTTWYMQNPRKSIYENLSCAVKKYQVVCVELTSPQTMLALTIEANLKWTEPDKMTAVLVAANFVDRRLFDITGDTYHFTI